MTIQKFISHSDFASLLVSLSSESGPVPIEIISDRGFKLCRINVNDLCYYLSESIPIFGEDIFYPMQFHCLDCVNQFLQDAIFDFLRSKELGNV